MNTSMYRSEEINAENPVEVENNLSIFEQEIAPLFKDLNTLDNITLTRKQMESLRIFLMLLSFRSDLRMKQYKDKRFDENTKEFLDEFKGDEDFELFWKKEINKLSKCRSLEDIKNAEEVDLIIKTDFTNLLNGYYMTIVEARGQDFIISDVYPTLEIFPLNDNVNIHLHFIYPISPTRVILLNHIMFREIIQNKQSPEFKPMIDVSRIKGNMVKEPKNRYKISPQYHTPDDEFIYRVTKIYEKDVAYVNTLLLNETRNGFAFRQSDRIEASISQYNSNYRMFNKNNFDKLEQILENKKKE